MGWLCQFPSELWGVFIFKTDVFLGGGWWRVGAGVGTAICLVKGINSLICAVVGGGGGGEDLASVLSVFAPKQRRTSLVNPTDTLLSSPRSRFPAPPIENYWLCPPLGLSSLAVPLINESARLMTASPILLVNSPPGCLATVRTPSGASSSTANN